MFNMNSKVVGGHADPPMTSNDIVVSKLVRFTSNVSASSPLSVTTAAVLSKLAGGSAVWSELRFKKIEVWATQSSQSSVIGSDSETLIVTIPRFPGIAGAVPGGDGASFADNGTYGKRRPHVAVLPPMLVQQRWIEVGVLGEPDLLAQVSVGNGEASGTAVIIHVSVDLRALGVTQ